MKSFLLILSALTLFSCTKTEIPTPSTLKSTTTSGNYVFSVGISTGDTILNTTYIQVNKGSKIYFPNAMDNQGFSCNVGDTITVYVNVKKPSNGGSAALEIMSEPNGGHITSNFYKWICNQDTTSQTIQYTIPK